MRAVDLGRMKSEYSAGLADILLRRLRRMEVLTLRGAYDSKDVSSDDDDYNTVVLQFENALGRDLLALILRRSVPMLPRDCSMMTLWRKLRLLG